MNQFQIINRHETWRDEKKDENKQDPADKKKTNQKQKSFLPLISSCYI